MPQSGYGPDSAFEPAPPPPATPAGEGAPSPSVWERTARVFVNPARAWDGLETRTRWWFPALVIWLISATLLVVTFQRIMVPMQMEQLSRMVDSGQIPADKLDKIAADLAANPMAMIGIVAVQSAVLWLGFLCLGLLAWFGTGFILGGKISYRLSLEVAAWAALVGVPGTLITFAVGWANESLKNIHLGLGAVLPPEESPTRLHAILAGLLDVMGPFNLWFLFVLIMGCSTLSGLPRKNVAWVMTGLYLAISVILALVTGYFGSGA